MVTTCSLCSPPRCSAIPCSGLHGRWRSWWMCPATIHSQTYKWQCNIGAAGITPSLCNQHIQSWRFYCKRHRAGRKAGIVQDHHGSKYGWKKYIATTSGSEHYPSTDWLFYSSCLYEVRRMKSVIELLPPTANSFAFSCIDYLQSIAFSRVLERKIVF